MTEKAYTPETLVNVAKDLRAEADRLEAKAEKMKAVKVTEGDTPKCLVSTCFFCVPC